MSSVVTPKSFFGSKTPLDLRVSAKTGTVELTGFETTPINALGQQSAIPLANYLQIDALILKRSSLVIPGLRGTPAGMITADAPVKACFKPSLSLVYPVTVADVSK